MDLISVALDRFQLSPLRSEVQTFARVDLHRRGAWAASRSVSSSVSRTKRLAGGGRSGQTSGVMKPLLAAAASLASLAIATGGALNSAALQFVTLATNDPRAYAQVVRYSLIYGAMAALTTVACASRARKMALVCVPSNRALCRGLLWRRKSLAICLPIAVGAHTESLSGLVGPTTPRLPKTSQSHGSSVHDFPVRTDA